MPALTLQIPQIADYSISSLTDLAHRFHLQVNHMKITTSTKGNSIHVDVSGNQINLDAFFSRLPSPQPSSA